MKDGQVGQAPLVDEYLKAIQRRLPVVAYTLKAYGSLSVEEYLQQVTRHAQESYQPRAEVASAIYDYATPLLGEQAARQTGTELVEYPVVLTANHHGVDYFAQSVQSTLLFSLRSPDGEKTARTVPVLACGNVSLNNLTYPRGILCYEEAVDTGLIPRKLAIFPKRLKPKAVARVQGFDEPMLRRTECELARMVAERQLSATSGKVVRDLLARDYRALKVLALDNYSDQAVLLNGSLWQQLFSPVRQPPPLLYLEQEKVVGRLLQADMDDRHSLAFMLLFDTGLREQLLRALDGVPCCWSLAGLTHRWHDRNRWRQLSPSPCGTFWFWGIDEQGRRVPLLPINHGGEQSMLCGVNERGTTMAIPLTPQAIAREIAEGRLLPSGFSCFLALAFARGITCIGGYYQADYLPAMQRVLLRVLASRNRFAQAMSRVAQVPTRSYLSGMQTVMRRTGQGGLLPAGPVEIIAHGGFGHEDMKRIGALSVRDAHIASLFETMADAASDTTMQPDWRRQLAVECAELLEDKVVVIN